MRRLNWDPFKPLTSYMPVRLYFTCSIELCLHFCHIHSHSMIKSHCWSFLERPITVYQNLQLGQRLSDSPHSVVRVRGSWQQLVIVTKSWELNFQEFYELDIKPPVGWMDKQKVVYSYNGIYLVIKRNEVLIRATLRMTLKTPLVKWKKPVIKVHILWVIQMKV